MIIQNRKDYLFFLEADRIALNRSNITKKKWVTKLIVKDEVWDFQKLLRRLEYLLNYKLKFRNNILTKIEYYFILWRFQRLSGKLNFIIPPNVFGPGLSIAHSGTIVVNRSAKVGANCCLNVGVTIGTKAGFSDEAPEIGDNVYIGPGAVVYGNIKIADNIAIGANSVINKSFEEENILVAGVPAIKIKSINIGSMLIKATEILALENNKKIGTN